MAGDLCALSSWHWLYASGKLFISSHTELKLTLSTENYVRQLQYPSASSIAIGCISHIRKESYMSDYQESISNHGWEKMCACKSI